jgi:hypothetical protein
MEAIISSETSVIPRATRRHIPENGILHSHRRGNLNSYTILMLSDTAVSTVTTCGACRCAHRFRRIWGTRLISLWAYLQTVPIIKPTDVRERERDCMLTLYTYRYVNHKTRIRIGTWMYSLTITATTDHNHREQLSTGSFLNPLGLCRPALVWAAIGAICVLLVCHYGNSLVSFNCLRELTGYELTSILTAIIISGWPHRKYRPSYCWGLAFLFVIYPSGIVGE